MYCSLLLVLRTWISLCTSLNSGLHMSGKIIYCICCVQYFQQGYFIILFLYVFCSSSVALVIIKTGHSWVNKKTILTHQNGWQKRHFHWAEANVWTVDHLVWQTRLKWDLSDTQILCCPSSKGSVPPVGNNRAFTVSAGLNAVGSINKSREYDMAEQALILPWQLLIYIPRVTESIFIFMSSNKLLPRQHQCWAPFVSHPHREVKPSRFWNSLKMIAVINFLR